MGFDMDVIISPIGSRPRFTDHRRERLDRQMLRTVDRRMDVVAMCLVVFDHRYDGDRLSEPLRSVAVDEAVENVEEVANVPRASFRCQIDR